MAKKLEEIKAQNAEEANKALGAQLNLVTALQDKMSDLIKIYREKGTLDKLSLDNIKSVTAATKAYKSEYDSVKEVQKDISRNLQLQNDITKQTNALMKKGGDGLKDEMKLLGINKLNWLK
jgi:formate-dependent nitrite reductase cytochrome c552 subunit